MLETEEFQGSVGHGSGHCSLVECTGWHLCLESTKYAFASERSIQMQKQCPSPQVSLQEPDPCCYFAVRSTEEREAEEDLDDRSSDEFFSAFLCSNALYASASTIFNPSAVKTPSTPNITVVAFDWNMVGAL